MSVPPAARPYPSDDLELATGYPLGLEDIGFPVATGVGRDPTEALQAAMASVLRRGRTYVSFSGGRDSSALLATATLTARREGSEEPVPITLRFPGVASTEETAWQERVVDHLGLERWEVIELGDELDLLGPIAQEVLLAHGPLWPHNVHFHTPIFRRARGARLITGFDGDGLLGGWRWSHAQRVLCGRVSPRPRDAARVALALSPAWARRLLMRPRILAGVTWLTDHGRTQLAARARSDEACQPRRWDRWLRTNYTRWRMVRVGAETLATVGRDHGVEVEFPLLDPNFLGALADAGGGAGHGDRTAMMRRLFAGALPEELNARRGKAEFGAAFWGPQTRAFAEGWDGSGLGTELVDHDKLREAWRLPNPLFGAGMLIQMIWARTQATLPPA